MSNKKYPLSLFIIGFITNVLFHFFWLFLPSIILLIIGLFVEPCLYIGLTILLFDVIVSFIEQIKIRQACLNESDNSDFKAFQDALSKEGNWKDNIGDFLNQKISDPQNEMKTNNEKEDE